MNTIIENTDATSEENKSFTDIRAKWKALAADRKIKSQDIAARCIYLAVMHGEGREGALLRLKKAFTPITNPQKLDNGAYPYYGLSVALSFIRTDIKHNRTSTESLTWLTDEERKEILAIVSSIDAYAKEIK